MAYKQVIERATHIIIASIGNPEPYLNTLHSAGHIALECLRQEMDLPPFQPQRPFYLRTSSLTSGNAKYTLMRSPMLMNDSGRWVEQLWRGAVLYHQDYGGVPGLLLVHDMLNMEIGRLKVRRWESRHRGHNGLKSVESYLPREEFPLAPMSKLAIGIGSPPTWEKQDLVKFLLQPLDKHQEEGLGRIGPMAVKKVKFAEKEWGRAATMGAGSFKRLKKLWGGEDIYDHGRG